MGQTLEPTMATCEVVLEAERRRVSGSRGESSSSGSSSGAASPLRGGGDMPPEYTPPSKTESEKVYGIACIVVEVPFIY